MFQLSDFYGYCKQNDVDVMPFAMLPRAACTVRDGQNYAVVLNFKRLHTVRQMRTAMLHESGHLHTGALHAAILAVQRRRPRRVLSTQPTLTIRSSSSSSCSHSSTVMAAPPCSDSAG